MNLTYNDIIVHQDSPWLLVYNYQKNGKFSTTNKIWTFGHFSACYSWLCGLHCLKKARAACPVWVYGRVLIFIIFIISFLLVSLNLNHIYSRPLLFTQLWWVPACFADEEVISCQQYLRTWSEHVRWFVQKKKKVVWRALLHLIADAPQVLNICTKIGI